MNTSQNPAAASKLSRALLWTGAAFPFVLSLVFHAVGPTGRVAAKGPQRPELVFDQYMVDLGRVEPSRFVFAKFRFKNRSDHTVVIKQLKPSCGCLNPRLSKRTYKPHETGEFVLRVQTANEEPGPKEYFVTLKYENALTSESQEAKDKTSRHSEAKPSSLNSQVSSLNLQPSSLQQPREVRLTFKVTLPEEKVVVRPKALIFYQFGTEPTTREIQVSDYRSEQLTITGVECSSKLVTTRLASPVIDADGTTRQRVLVTIAAEVPPGRSQALVTILTDDPVYPKLEVPLLIQGPGKRPAIGTKAKPRQPQRQ